jgi:hypothetical protein
LNDLLFGLNVPPANADSGNVPFGDLPTGDFNIDGIIADLLSGMDEPNSSVSGLAFAPAVSADSFEPFAPVLAELAPAPVDSDLLLGLFDLDASFGGVVSVPPLPVASAGGVMPVPDVFAGDLEAEQVLNDLFLGLDIPAAIVGGEMPVPPVPVSPEPVLFGEHDVAIDEILHGLVALDTTFGGSATVFSGPVASGLITKAIDDILQGLVALEASFPVPSAVSAASSQATVAGSSGVVPGALAHPVGFRPAMNGDVVMGNVEGDDRVCGDQEEDLMDTREDVFVSLCRGTWRRRAVHVHGGALERPLGVPTSRRVGPYNVRKCKGLSSRW